MKILFGTLRTWSRTQVTHIGPVHRIMSNAITGVIIIPAVSA